MIGPKRERQLARQRADWVNRGLLYCVVWTEGDYMFGPHAVATLTEAVAMVDDMIARKRIPMPNDLHARQGECVYLVAHIEQYRDGQWIRVDDSEKRCLCRIDYPDARS